MRLERATEGAAVVIGGPTLVDERGHPGQHVGVDVGQHAVTEVEDVARRVPALLDDLAHAPLEGLPRREEQGRVEVALHGIRRPEPLDGVGQRHAVVDADHLGPGLAHEGQQLARADPEVDAGHVEVGDGGERGGGVRLARAA